jgi:signal transduction histidine kinase
MSRSWIWIQLAIAWLPMWALFTALIMIAHGSGFLDASIGSFRMVAPGALLGIGVHRLASRWPWPHPFRIAFVGLHVVSALMFSGVWYFAVCLIDSVITGRMTFMMGPGMGPFVLTGIWLYIVIAAAAYANLAAQRAAKMEAFATRMQLDALRSQLHPHFLFNALHTVVQLIPTRPRDAARAAEQLAGVLRTTIEEQRDEISLAEELAFVERYLAIESIRFGDRLHVLRRIDEEAREAGLPSFALQTLVENAVRHGAAPRVEATEVSIAATLAEGFLVLTVTDDAAGADLQAVESGNGTGLRRLRERLRWLYGERAKLLLTSAPGQGFTAVLRVPLRDDHD